MIRVNQQIVSAIGVVTSILFVTATPTWASVHVENAAIAHHSTRAHTTGVVTRTYQVNTTSDSQLWSSAPPHACEDVANHAQCSIRAAMESVNNDFNLAPFQWDVIVMPAGDYKLSSSVGSSLAVGYSGNLSVQGAGASSTTIDGSSGFNQELFYTDSSGDSVSFSGVNFKGGYETNDAGGVWLSSGSRAVFDHCAFTNNYANNSGGAIYADSGAILSVKDSTFSGNSAQDFGGAIYDDSFTPLTLSGDTFSHNAVDHTSASSYEGGAIYSSGPLYLDNDTLTGNTAYGDGGAVYGASDVVASNDTFTGNHSYSYYAGALYGDENVILDNSHLSGNSAYADGGALYANYSGSLNNDTFNNNSSSGSGGDIVGGSSLTINNSNFSHSTAIGDGGSVVIYPTQTFTANNTTFTNETSTSSSSSGGGGAIALSSASGSFNHVTITGSKDVTGDGNGGALLCNTCTVSINNSTFTNNSAAYAGGAIDCYTDCGFTIDNSNISDNTGEWGGGVMAEYNTYLSIDNSTLDSNNSTYYWGGAISSYSGSTINVINSTLAHNKALGSEGYGGALAVYDETNPSYATLVNDTLYDNHAYYGGALYTYESYLTVNSSTIASNGSYGSGYGGGLYTNTSTVTSTNSIWSGNANEQCSGGAIATSGGFNIDSDNTCGFGAAGDLLNTNANLGTLAMNGGTTATAAPLGNSPAIGHGGSSCQAADQRGVLVPSSQTCDIGAVFVEKTTTTLTPSTLSITHGHEASETFHVTVTAAVGTQHPTGTASIFAGAKLLCVAAITPKIGSASAGSCSLTASQLAAGSHAITALYNANGVLAGSLSAAKTVKIH